MNLLALLGLSAFFMLAGFAHADDTLVILNTEQGRLVLEFFHEDASDHANNFVTLARDGFYTGTWLHQPVSGLIVQGGDPGSLYGDATFRGAGDPPYSLDVGFDDIAHNGGILSMIGADGSHDVGSQFFLVHQNANHLDGVHTPFGRLATHGSYGTLDFIAAASAQDKSLSAGPVRILNVEITTRDEAVSAGIPVIDQGPPTRAGHVARVASGDIYESEKLNLAVQFPRGWAIQHAGGPGLPDVAVTSIPPSGIPASIGVYVEDAGNRTFDGIALNKIRDIEESVAADAVIEKNQELSVLGKRDVLVSDVSFARTSLEDTADAIVKIRKVTVMDLPTNTVYEFLFSADIDDFDKYLIHFDEILHTFDTITKPQLVGMYDQSQTVDGAAVQLQTDDDTDDAADDADDTSDNDYNTDATTVTVSAASYDWDSNTLVISFTGPIGPLVDLSHITVVDSYCATKFTFEEYHGRGSDRMSVTIEPNEIQRMVLAGMPGPNVYVLEGAFTDVDSAALITAEIPMTVTGERPRGDHPCIITYGSNELLLEAYAHNYTQTLQAVHDGFSAWSDLNPDLKFVWVERNPLIWIDWAEYQPEYIGLACIWCLGYEASMDIILYGYNCKGERIHHSPGSVRNTVAHEVGHILGLEHHINKTHMMYGEEYVQDPFPTLGYTIPELLPEGFIGQDELTSRYEAIGEMLDQMQIPLENLGQEIEKFASRYGDERGGVIYFSTNTHLNQYNNMVYDHRDMVAEYNALVDEYNALADDLNCMYEADPPGH